MYQTPSLSLKSAVAKRLRDSSQCFRIVHRVLKQSEGRLPACPACPACRQAGQAGIEPLMFLYSEILASGSEARIIPPLFGGRTAAVNTAQVQNLSARTGRQTNHRDSGGCALNQAL